MSEDELLAAANLAVELQEEASNGTTHFDELIRLHNKDQDLPADGYVITRSYNIAPEYATEAFSMAEGEVKTILTQFGYYTMKKYSVLDPTVYTAVDRQKALLEMKSAEFEGLITGTKSTSSIVYNQELLKTIRIEELTYGESE